jgi:predicted acyltransferase
MNQNLVSAVDVSVLGRTHRDGWGTVLGTLPTIATTLVGLMLGQMLRSSQPERTKLRVIALTGLGCLAGGYALSPVVPIIMKLWTTSYALVVTGWACLLFLPFYWVIDVKGSRAWSFPLVVIGTNALAAYLLPTIVPLGRIVGTFTKTWTPGLGAAAGLVTSAAVFLTGWLILWWMYRRKIFLRV